MKSEEKHDIILIRHAQSVFNEGALRTMEEMGLGHLSWDEMIQNDEYNERATYNQLYIDPWLSEAGRKQCQKYRSECEGINPDLIIVSPYKRALETCQRLFQNVENVPVIVEPILAEVFRFACDVPEELENMIKNFPRFDFQKVIPLGDKWFMPNLVPEYQDKINEKLKHECGKQNRKMLLSLLAKRQVFEQAKMLRDRVAKIKQMLVTYKQKYPKIVLIAHNYVIAFIKAKGFTETGDLTEYQETINCRPYYENLEDLLKIQ